MTRINSDFDVKKLTDEFLLAEHREIKRIPYNHEKAIKSGSIKKLPKEFCLGKGHVLFFVGKPKFTYDRYIKLYNECIARGFNVTDYRSNWEIFTHEDYILESPYIASEFDIALIKARIWERVSESYQKGNIHHYKGKPLTIEEVSKIIFDEHN